jgi:hypothetical protein
MPRAIVYAGLIVFCLALVPVALIARARAVKSPEPRLLLIPDMAIQPRFGPQDSNPLFADGRAMRGKVSGTVKRTDRRTDEAYTRGKDTEGWVTEFPVPVREAFIIRGRERYEVFCAPCHGLVGNGNGTVSLRAQDLETPGWVPPVSFHSDLIRGRPVGHLYNTITNGIRSMPSYGSQIDVADRWAIVAYLRALQKSRNATMEDVPPDMRPALD